jgi:hypothetical protein
MRFRPADGWSRNQFPKDGMLQWIFPSSGLCRIRILYHFSKLCGQGAQNASALGKFFDFVSYYVDAQEVPILVSNLTA